MEPKTQNILRKGENTIVLATDKEKMSIILDRTDYNEIVKQLPNNTTDYRSLEADPILKLKKNTNRILKNLLNRQMIANEKCWMIRAETLADAQFQIPIERVTSNSDKTFVLQTSSSSI